MEVLSPNPTTLESTLGNKGKRTTFSKKSKITLKKTKKTEKRQNKKKTYKNGTFFTIFGKSTFMHVTTALFLYLKIRSKIKSKVNIASQTIATVK